MRVLLNLVATVHSPCLMSVQSSWNISNHTVSLQADTTHAVSLKLVMSSWYSDNGWSVERKSSTIASVSLLIRKSYFSVCVCVCVCVWCVWCVWCVCGGGGGSIGSLKGHMSMKKCSQSYGGPEVHT